MTPPPNTLQTFLLISKFTATIAIQAIIISHKEDFKSHLPGHSTPIFLLLHYTIYVPCINQSNILKYNTCHIPSYLKLSKKLSVPLKWNPVSITSLAYRFIIQCCLLPLQFSHSFTVLQQYWTSILSHMHVNHYLRLLDWFFLLLYSWLECFHHSDLKSSKSNPASSCLVTTTTLITITKFVPISLVVTLWKSVFAHLFLVYCLLLQECVT